jgi:nucleoside-diphosphate-sugar epimerase
VYGLLSRNGNAITEDAPVCAVEPYGRSKLEGEKAVIEISKTSEMHSIIIRPTAVFGPGDHTLFGKNLRRAAYSRLLLSGGFKNKKFNYVHVQDVADAAIYLMEHAGNEHNVFNINVNDAITYENAFESYMQALEAAGWRHIIPRVLGYISRTIEQLPGIIRWLNANHRSRFVFRVWKPGFDLTYSSQRLLASSFRFEWQNFEHVIASCLNNSINDSTQSPI